MHRNPDYPLAHKLPACTDIQTACLQIIPDCLLAHKLPACTEIQTASLHINPECLLTHIWSRLSEWDQRGSVREWQVGALFGLTVRDKQHCAAQTPPSIPRLLPPLPPSVSFQEAGLMILSADAAFSSTPGDRSPFTSAGTGAVEKGHNVLKSAQIRDFTASAC